MAVLPWCPFFVSRQTYGKNEFPTQLKSNPMQDFVEYEYVTKHLLHYSLNIMLTQAMYLFFSILQLS